MSLFDLLIFQKIAAAMSHTTVDAAGGVPVAATSSDQATLSDSVELSNPGTSYDPILDVSGSGFLLNLELQKPSTTNAVKILYQITLDGTVIAAGLGATNTTSTSARDSIIVGQVQLADPTNARALPPVFLPFHTSLKIEAKYNSDPGGAENINTTVHAVYS